MKTNFKKAWTLAEMTIAITILIVISSIFITKVRPATQKNKIYMYAAIKNLQQGNIAVQDMSLEGLEVSNKTIAGKGTFEGYCFMLADAFGLGEVMYCPSESPDASKVNLKLPNGIEYYGLANPWVAITGTEYKYKNILVDINGVTGEKKGRNKLGYDQFPLRVFSGGNLDGHVYPVDCSATEKFYKTSDGNTYVELPKSDYCKGVISTGLGASASSLNFTTDKEVVVYDVIKGIPKETTTITRKVATAQSFIQADCMAYGGYGYFSVEQCKSAQIKVAPHCATTLTCSTCKTDTGNICPDKNLSGATINTPSVEQCNSLISNDEDLKDIQCVVIQHKPSSGASLLIDSMISDIDM